jgi:catechol 2,3-dioxygenase-like lactoylglutathione lyase family enzyme
VKVEHLAMNVPEPARQAEWWCANLGCRVVRSADAPVEVRFLADSSGSVLFEVYRNDAAPVPDYASLDPLVLHMAFESDDVRADRDRLVAAGATVVTDAPPSPVPGSDDLVMLRDPWGLAVQLVTRAEPMA